MITEEQKEQIIELGKKNLTGGQIAIKLGIKKSTCDYHLTSARKEGIIPPAKNSPKKVKTEKPEAEKPVEKEKLKYEWYTMPTAFEGFALAVFGKGSRFISSKSDNTHKIANLVLTTARGETIKLSAEDITGKDIIL